MVPPCSILGALRAVVGVHVASVFQVIGPDHPVAPHPKDLAGVAAVFIVNGSPLSHHTVSSWREGSSNNLADHSKASAWRRRRGQRRWRGERWLRRRRRRERGRGWPRRRARRRRREGRERGQQHCGLAVSAHHEPARRHHARARLAAHRQQQIVGARARSQGRARSPRRDGLRVRRAAAVREAAIHVPTARGAGRPPAAALHPHADAEPIVAPQPDGQVGVVHRGRGAADHAPHAGQGRSAARVRIREVARLRARLLAPDEVPLRRALVLHHAH